MVDKMAGPGARRFRLATPPQAGAAVANPGVPAARRRVSSRHHHFAMPPIANDAMNKVSQPPADRSCTRCGEESHRGNA